MMRNEEKVTYFLKEIYTKCQEVELKPQQVFDYISDILKFSSEIPISEIPKFMKKRIEEKERLESAVQELSTKINELTKIKEEIEQEIERLSKIKEIMSKTYKTFTIAQISIRTIRNKNGRYGACSLNSVVGMSKENYDYVQVLAKIADHEKLEKDSKYYK